MDRFKTISQELGKWIGEWEPKLLSLPTGTLMDRHNKQGRNIKQIIGHMVDSASNNTHRIVHLQYAPTPLVFPDYASFGNNDKWIAIQNYLDEDWGELVQLWKCCNLHVAHVVCHINPSCLDNAWISGPGQEITLNEMVADFPRHFELHLGEISELIENV